jgi:hypothetical protein
MKAARTIAYVSISLLLLLIGALVLVGCSAENSTATEPAAVAGSEPFVASAMLGARGQGGGSTTQVGDVTQVRNGTASYDVEATDPRLAGIFDVVYNYDEAADGTATMWGTWRLKNDEGTWICDSWRGAFDEKGHTFTVGLTRGTGAYEGLVSLWQWYWPLAAISPATGLPDTSEGLPLMAVSGWVQKAQ